MNNFKSWGLRVRRDPSKNYYSVWNDLVTTRPDVGEPSPLDPDRSEFYDVGITERCNAGCSFCFTGETPVMTNKGTTPISGLKIGDNILSYDNNSDNLEIRKVSQVHVRDYSGELINILLESGELIRVTPDHLFLTKNRGWVKAKELTIEDDLYDSLG